MARLRVYASPSNQIGNRYWGTVKTNEAEAMEAVYWEFVKLAKVYDFTLLPTTLAKRPFGSSTSRVAEAISLGADIYLAFHSNATGSPPSKYVGAIIYYKLGNEERWALAEAMRVKLNAAQPYTVNATGHRDGYYSQYGEVYLPQDAGIDAYLVEIHFHDNPMMADWIAKNPTRIASAILQALVETYKIKKIGEVDPPSPMPTPTDTYTVKSGDSLPEISYAVLGRYDRWLEIAELNGIKDPYYIYPGQILKIPSSTPAPKPPAPEPEKKTVYLPKGTPIFPKFATDFVEKSTWYTIREEKDGQILLDSERGVVVRPAAGGP